MTKPEFIYTTYIKTTPQKLWDALTNHEFMKQYWFGTYCESEWKTGSSWKMVHADGQITDAGEIIESTPPKRLVIKWRHEWKPELKAEGYSRCIFEIRRKADCHARHGSGRIEIRRSRFRWLAESSFQSQIAPRNGADRLGEDRGLQNQGGLKV